MQKTKSASFRFSFLSTAAASLRLSLVAASIVYVLPVQAETVEQPPALSIPFPIDDDIVIEPARRPIEQPISKPSTTAEEADRKREAADREAWQQARTQAGGDAAERTAPAKTLQAYQSFLKSHPDLHRAIAVDAGIRIAQIQEEGLKSVYSKY